METHIRSEQSQSILKAQKFKMETPETIRTSLQQGEWVTSIDFKDAYFHILIQEQSRKYLRFHIQGQTYQFKALPFGLSTAPMEFNVIAKEVKIMATQKDIRIHQYLVQMCQQLGWVVNLEKIRTGTQTDFQLCRLPVRPQSRPGPAHTGPVANPSRENTNTAFIHYRPVWSGSSCP